MTDSKPKAVNIAPPKSKGGAKKPDDAIKPGPDEPKSKPTEPAGKQPNGRRSPGRPPKREKQLQELFTGLGLVVSMGNQFDGMLITKNSEELAEAWAKLALENKTVAKVIDSFLETSIYAEVILLTVSIIVPVLQNHRVLPAGLPTPFETPPWIVAQRDQDRPVNGNGPTIL